MGFWHSKLSFLSRSHSYDPPVEKKSNLLNVRWRTTVQSKELSPILHDFEDLVKHSRFFPKTLVSEAAVNRDLLTPNYRLWADHIHMIRLSNKSNLLNVRWRTTVQSKELSPILYDFEDLVKHSRFFRKRFRKKLCKSAFRTLQTGVSEQITFIWSASRKKATC